MKESYKLSDFSKVLFSGKIKINSFRFILINSSYGFTSLFVVNYGNFCHYVIFLSSFFIFNLYI